MQFIIYGYEWCFKSFNLKSFQNITSDHKSRNVWAVHAIFCLLYSKQNHFLMFSTLHALSAHYLKHFSVVFQNAHMFYFNQSYNNYYNNYNNYYRNYCDRQTEPKIVFSVSGIIILSFIQLLSLNFQRVQYRNPVLHSITNLCIHHWPIRNGIFYWANTVIMKLMIFFMKHKMPVSFICCERPFYCLPNLIL